MSLSSVSDIDSRVKQIKPPLNPLFIDKKAFSVKIINVTPGGGGCPEVWPETLPT